MNNDRTTLNQRMGRLETRIEQLAKIVADGFERIDTRIDNIEKRLDYNNLKRLPK